MPVLFLIAGMSVCSGAQGLPCMHGVRYEYGDMPGKSGSLLETFSRAVAFFHSRLTHVIPMQGTGETSFGLITLGLGPLLIL